MTTSLPHPRSGKPVPRFRLFLLALAFGVLPAFGNTITVTNTTDTTGTGSGSLRAAIAAAMPGDTITFNSGLTGTITLTSGVLQINTSLTITGPGPAQLAISGNKASGVFAINSGTVTISGLTIENGSNGNVGGGITNDGTLYVTNSTISGNSSGQFGGGIYNDGTLYVTNSTISGNSAQVGGGGIFNNSTLYVTNSTFSGDSAGNGGGGIYNNNTLYVTNSTFSANSADNDGGGIFTSGSVTIKSTLLAGNSTGQNCGFSNGSVTSQGYNLSDDSSCISAFDQPGDLNHTPAQLDPHGLQNNGGPTQTVALLPGGPAVDHIPDANCTDTNDKPVTTDQRGVSRPQGKGCDVGAYELVQSVPFSSFNPSLAIDDGKHPGFVLTSTFTLGSASTGLNPATEAMTLEIASYTLTLPAGSFHKLWNASDAPYGYEGTVNGATVVLGLVPLGNNTYSFDAAGSPVTFTGIKNPVTVTLTFGTDTGTANVQALLTSF